LSTPEEDKVEVLVADELDPDAVAVIEVAAVAPEVQEVVDSVQ
jgi:hypothetical protein